VVSAALWFGARRGGHGICRRWPALIDKGRALVRLNLESWWTLEGAVFATGKASPCTGEACHTAALSNLGATPSV
jgi:hypothetical protein